MKVTSLIDNVSNTSLPPEHGLSLYLELASGHRVLFDMGQGSLFAENAAKLHLDLSLVDLAIVSHGHYDHGGGLPCFLSLNQKARVYIHREAFRPHYSMREEGLTFNGLDASVENSNRLTLCDGVFSVSSELTLFSGVTPMQLPPPGNDRLFGPDGMADTFRHEQNLIVREGDKTILFAGCAHQGILNIINRATQLLGFPPSHVFAGMHLAKSGLSPESQADFIRRLAKSLGEYADTQFYTMHCTGQDGYDLLRQTLGEKIQYLSCGECIYIE